MHIKVNEMSDKEAKVASKKELRLAISATVTKVAERMVFRVYCNSLS
jgi:hypothetical protein